MEDRAERGRLEPTRRLCLEDTHLFRFEAEVVAVRRARGGYQEIALDRSAFYSESGGQPSDRGILAGRRVEALHLEQGVLWHAVAASEGGGRKDEDEADLPALRPGVIATGEIDAPFRLDAMRQHSGQHVLSQAFVQVTGSPTVGFHLGREESTIDLAGPPPEAGGVAAAVDLANSVVLRDVPVHVHLVNRAELGRYPLRRDPGADLEVLRLIEIEGFDWSACGGTHAGRTGEIGPIHVLGWEKVRAARRMRFLAGERTLRYLAGVHHVVEETAREASLHWERIPEAARAWTARISDLTRELREMRTERARREAERLFRDSAPGKDGVRHVAIWLGLRSAEELRELAGHLVSLGPSVLLAGSEEGAQASWVAARSSELPSSIQAWSAGVFLRGWLTRLGGKGGGNAFFAQGGSPPVAEDRIGPLLEEWRRD